MAQPTPPPGIQSQSIELCNIIRGSRSLLRDANLCSNVIRDSEQLLIEVINEESERVIFDNNTREVRDTDIEQALTRVCETTDISNLISILYDQNIDRDAETIFNIICEEESGNLDPHFTFCMYCMKYERMQTHDQIKRGDCLRFPRICGLYYHYAIVKEVQEGSNSSCCKLTLIHLTKVGKPFFVQVIEQTKTYHLRKQIVEKVIYKSNPFTPDKIIQRAEKYAAQNTTPRVYRLFRDNCEHLANQFAQGVNISPQVHRRLDQLKSGWDWIFGVLCKIGSVILQRPEIAEIGIVASLKNIIRKMVQMKNFLLNNFVCFSCYKKKYERLKVSLVLGVTNLAVSVIDDSGFPTLTISLIIGIALPLVARSVCSFTMPLINTVVAIPNTLMISIFSNVIKLLFSYLPHGDVVSTVHGIRPDKTRLKAAIIHCPWPRRFGTCTVTEETIYFNQTYHVSVLDFEGTYHFPASFVVWKARKELGKQNFSKCINISSHFSRYCKTGSKNITTLPTVPVRSIHDLSPGDVIRFNYYGLPHEAVFVRIA